MTTLASLYVAVHRTSCSPKRPPSDSPGRGRGKVRRGRAVRSIWSFLNGPDNRPLSLPTLTDYPFPG